MILIAIMIAAFGVASIFGYMIFSSTEASINITAQTNETNATYNATSNVVVAGMTFMQVIAWLFVFALVFVAAYLMVRWQ